MKYWVGSFTGVLLGAFQLLMITGFISRSDRHVSWALSKELENHDWSQAYDLRGDYLDEQVSALLTAPNFNFRANYRMIVFEGIGRILICADNSADLKTGFIFPTSNGFKTFLPDQAEIVFEVNKICSIRI
ncbi:hypothetical protein [Roseinatronobacter sp.]|uniref:hypothetical protein n=1 Tax=Roseinatronobacter sp. TaxID=1945755 RepID=UPI0025DED4EB|nr:hypothetical protein [Roseibaca sp.]